MEPPQSEGPGAAGPFAELHSPDAATYIIPPMSGMPPPAAPAPSFSGGSATIASVVRMFLAIEAAFCSAERVTMVGSMTPALIRSPYSPVVRVEALARLHAADLVDHDRALEPGVLGDLAERLLERAADDLRARCASSASSRSLGSIASCAFSSATPPPGTMPSSSAARVACSASSTRCFFSFISVSVAAPTLTTATPPASFASRSWSFSRSKSESVFSISERIWLIRPSICSLLAGAVDDRRRVLGDDDAAGLAELRELGVLELQAHLLGDHLAAGEDRDVLEHPLAAVAEPGRLDRDAGEGAAELVDDQGRERLALDVLGDDHQRLAALHHLLEHRQQVAHRADLLVGDQDVRVLEHRLHALLVGDHVRARCSPCRTASPR